MGKLPKPLRTPTRFDRLIEAVMERDRAYFRENPSEQAYVRVYVPGEFWPVGMNADYVQVIQVADGFRLRRPLKEGDLNDLD